MIQLYKDLDLRMMDANLLGAVHVAVIHVFTQIQIGFLAIRVNPNPYT
jgi:hypothetical protein